MKFNKAYSLFAFISVLLFSVLSCSGTDYAASGALIVNAKEASGKLEDGYILVDAQKASAYKKGHIAGAVNIERKAIMVKKPVPNTLAPADIIAAAAGNAGLTETDDLVIYDSNKNMDASRLMWTLKVYGHKGDILIVSGGKTALEGEGLEVTTEATAVEARNYATTSPDKSMMATKEDILAMIDDPAENFVLIDVRSDEEYNAGNIPGSVHINHERNMFINKEKGSTFRPVSHNRILYKEMGITPECEIVMYCKSSVRAANTYAALYNAGYRNLKIYDGAWLEWSKEKLPVFKPEVKIQATSSSGDNS